MTIWYSYIRRLNVQNSEIIVWLERGRNLFEDLILGKALKEIGLKTSEYDDFLWYNLNAIA